MDFEEFKKYLKEKTFKKWIAEIFGSFFFGSKDITCKSFFIYKAILANFMPKCVP